MKILVTGGRNFTDIGLLFSTLDEFHVKHSISLLVEGGATGADIFAQFWAEERGVPFRTYLVSQGDWQCYGKRAGLVRNCLMLREQRPQLVVAFQGGSGTRHMVRIAEEAGIQVIKTWEPDSLAKFLL